MTEKTHTALLSPQRCTVRKGTFVSKKVIGYNIQPLSPDVPDAMKDLDRVLQLTEVRGSRARALALCQRGVLLRKRGSDDEARAAFAEAAKLGSAFAKKQVTNNNL